VTPRAGQVDPQLASVGPCVWSLQPVKLLSWPSQVNFCCLPRLHRIANLFHQSIELRDRPNSTPPSQHRKTSFITRDTFGDNKYLTSREYLQSATTGSLNYFDQALSSARRPPPWPTIHTEVRCPTGPTLQANPLTCLQCLQDMDPLPGTPSIRAPCPAWRRRRVWVCHLSLPLAALLPC
jgi:hypothetical protein